MVASILATFPSPFHPQRVERLGNAGGFSGAQLWRVHTSLGELCVRRWPAPHPSPSHLQWIHEVLQRAQRAGCDFLPVPYPNRTGETVIASDGKLWEVTPWMAGQATLKQQFSAGKLNAACRALAQFHQATADANDGPLPHSMDPSPGISQRYQVARDFHTRLPDLTIAVGRLPESPIRELCADLLGRAGTRLPGLLKSLESIRELPLALQPCIRDFWYPHVLYEGDTLTGVIDFGAMRVDSVALDLGRLLSSIAHGHSDVWRLGMDAYSSVRELTRAERNVMPVAAQATAVLSGLNWVNWLAVDQRSFEAMDRVERRIAEILEQLAE